MSLVHGPVMFELQNMPLLLEVDLLFNICTIAMPGGSNRNQIGPC